MKSEHHSDELARVSIRMLMSTDNLEELTQLLNIAYKKLADKGFKYLASRQDSQTTKRRVEKGQCFVAILDNKLVGAITYYSPDRASGHEWYDQNFVASYGQFAVDPQMQGLGLGGQLIKLVEDLATKDGAKEITIDTAEGADLVNFYSKKGYRFVAYAQWKQTNYRSVLLSKKLA